jgi:hypothetical protein
MKRDLSVIAKELFPNLVQNTYEQLLYSYTAEGKTNINPKISLDEAISKYTPFVLNVMENKDNWVNRCESIFIDFHDFLTVFGEYFPLYKSDDGIPYMDIGIWNYEIGRKILSLLITKIFYLNYTGMDVRDVIFIKEKPLEPEIIRIFLRLSDME